MEASDSPTRVLKSLAIRLRTSSTPSFVPACACSSKTTSPVVQCLARNPSTYWLPRLAIDPSRTAALAVSFADVPGQFRSQRRIGGLAHQAQSLPDPLIGDKAEERRLAELHRQPLPQHAVEHRVAGRVAEIGKDDRVSVGQCERCAARRYMEPATIAISTAAAPQDDHRPAPGADGAARICVAARARRVLDCQTLQVGLRMSDARW